MSAPAPARMRGEEMDAEKEILEHKAQIKLLEAKITALQNVLAREDLIDEDELTDEFSRLIKHDEHKK
jgi:hypothetical protein